MKKRFVPRQRIEKHDESISDNHSSSPGRGPVVFLVSREAETDNRPALPYLYRSTPGPFHKAFFTFTFQLVRRDLLIPQGRYLEPDRIGFRRSIRIFNFALLLDRDVKGT